MFEFHGWAVIRSRYDSDLEKEEADWEKIEEEFDLELRIFDRPDHFHVHKTINGLLSVTMSGLRNHRQEDVIDFFRWLAARAPGSYGLLYVHDDEDPKAENDFRVYRLAKGKLTEMADPFLSPYFPTVEEA
jgi:hypothetical protein